MIPCICTETGGQSDMNKQKIMNDLLAAYVLLPAQ
jgi:hypothetical protein